MARHLVYPELQTPIAKIEPGMRCSRWTVVGRAPDKKLGCREVPFAAWFCLCDCGTSKVVLEQSLRQHASRSCGCIRRELLARRAPRLTGPGPKNGRWKGGRRVDKRSGYVDVWLPNDDPMFCMTRNPRTTQGGYVFEHRLVMARYLGRPLTKYEEPHHKNGVRADNRIDNLQLRIKGHGAGSAFRCRLCGSCDIEAVPLEPAED